MFVAGSTLLVACEQSAEGSRASPSAAVAPAAQAAENATTAALVSASATATADAPRRGYGPVDVKLSPCASLEADNLIVGRSCASSIVVFGPYVGVPANSEVDVSFEVEATNRLAVVSDIVSDSAKRFHGALLEQWVEAGGKQRFGYRVHFFQGTPSLETRIFVRAGGPVDFKIRDLLINVR